VRILFSGAEPVEDRPPLTMGSVEEEGGREGGSVGVQGLKGGSLGWWSKEKR